MAGLRQLVASGNVELTGSKGELVKGERLQVRQGKDRSNWVLLEGAPATVVQEQTMLAGPFIEVDTATQKAVVTGGGKLVTSDARMAGGGKGRPVTVTWSGPGAMDGQKNLATVAGNVLVKYTDADGTTNEAAADRVEIELADRERTDDPRVEPRADEAWRRPAEERGGGAAPQRPGEADESRVHLLEGRPRGANEQGERHDRRGEDDRFPGEHAEPHSLKPRPASCSWVPMAPSTMTVREEASARRSNMARIVPPTQRSGNARAAMNAAS